MDSLHPMLALVLRSLPWSIPSSVQHRGPNNYRWSRWPRPAASPKSDDPKPVPKPYRRLCSASRSKRSGVAFETFTIPSACAGKLEGRSSFARMGLAVHCSADFINPGYRGHMPLQLVNLGKGSVRLFPQVPICQLVLVRLSSPPERVYGARELFSKYMDDDGGPSYWWRDKRIADLQAAFREFDVSERVQNEILELIGPREPELIEASRSASPIERLASRRRCCRRDCAYSTARIALRVRPNRLRKNL